MLTLDHVLLATNNLSAAAQNCTDLGFKVVFGGSRDRALNALVFLADGTLVELIGKDRFSRLIPLLHRTGITRVFGLMTDRIAAFPTVPAGFFNVCLHSPDLQSTYDQLTASGIAASRPTSFRRRRDDGVRIAWELVGTAPYELPFIIGDYRPGRLSDERFLRHANGAVGLASVTIGCKSLSACADVYSRLLRRPAALAEQDGQRRAEFLLGDKTITLLETGRTRHVFTPTDQSYALAFTVKYDHDGRSEVRDFPIEAVVDQANAVAAGAS